MLPELLVGANLNGALCSAATVDILAGNSVYSSVLGHFRRPLCGILCLQLYLMVTWMKKFTSRGYVDKVVCRK